MRPTINRKRFLEKLDLSVPCPGCGRTIEPAEQQRLSMDGTMRCPHCGQTFIEGRATMSEKARR